MTLSCAEGAPSAPGSIALGEATGAHNQGKIHSLILGLMEFGPHHTFTADHTFAFVDQAAADVAAILAILILA